MTYFEILSLHTAGVTQVNDKRSLPG